LLAVVVEQEIRVGVLAAAVAALARSFRTQVKVPVLTQSLLEPVEPAAQAVLWGRKKGAIRL